jgi:hypothetical protein
VSFSEKPSPEYHEMIIARGRQMMDQMPQVFTTLSDAGFYEEAIIRRAIAFVSHEIPFQKPPHPLHTFPMNGWWGCRDEKVLATLERMHTDALRWRAAFWPLWTRLKAKNNSSQLFSAALMRIRVVSALMGCTVITVANEEDHDRYYDDFKAIVDLSEYMLDILNSEISKDLLFNFDSYTVIPLFLTALKCRDFLMRRRAILLLFKYPRREGVCDSVCMGKLCEWALKIEEENLDEDGQKIPSWARLHGITMKRDPEKENTGTLMCEQRVSAFSDEVVIRSSQISWTFS